MARLIAAVAAGKAAAAASRLVGSGGTALPGLVAERVDPATLARLSRGLGRGKVAVTGTNGKTTTARLLAGIIHGAGIPTIHNRSGSNLMRGLTATMVAAAGPTGRIANARRTAGVFEIDEATLPQAVAAIQPTAVLFTNLFRDQLDRYGEVDSIITLWQRAIAALPPATTLLLNVDDPSVAALRRAARGPVVTYGIEDLSLTGDREEHPADSRWCGVCGGEFVYHTRYFWHIGHWRCPGCGDERPYPDVLATGIALGDGAIHMTLVLPTGPLPLTLPMSGLYNVYNALAAAAAADLLAVPPAEIRRGIEHFTAAFGRQERLRVHGRDVQIFLCKNPAGVNQVLHTITGAGPRASDQDGAARPDLHLLLLLNDGIADGRDVSWIWDVDYELMAGRAATVVVSGTRAADLALRLKYAGLSHQLQVTENARAAVTRALATTPAGGRLYVLPTYTAMLTVRDHLAALAGRPRFWKQ